MHQNSPQRAWELHYRQRDEFEFDPGRLMGIETAFRPCAARRSTLDVSHEAVLVRNLDDEVQLSQKNFKLTIDVQHGHKEEP